MELTSLYSDKMRFCGIKIIVRPAFKLVQKFGTFVFLFSLASSNSERVVSYSYACVSRKDCYVQKSYDLLYQSFIKEFNSQELISSCVVTELSQPSMRREDCQTICSNYFKVYNLGAKLWARIGSQIPPSN